MSYSVWILERSFGGLGTAVSPKSASTEGNWPDGPSSPMSREACNALVTACKSQVGEKHPQCMVYLVGGAGNGKSKLAADTVKAVGGRFIGKESSFAQRVYDYCLHGGGRLRVINDATIPPEDRHATPLVRDLTEAIRSGDHLLACINRGVLIGETGISVPSDSDTPHVLASNIVSWLLSGEFPEITGSGLRIELLDEHALPGHYSAARVYLGNLRHIVIHVVYMDHVSLLEQWSSTGQDSSDYRSSLSLSTIDVRPILSQDRRQSEAAFERCLSGAARAYSKSIDITSLDPIGANATTLSRTRVARGWCSLLRGAEIIAGTHFTYRELWALFAHSLVGPVTGDGLPSLADWVDARVVRAKTASGEKRLAALLELGTLRTHMLLFDSGTGTTISSSPIDEYAWPSTMSEALKSARRADPLLSFGPVDGIQATSLAEQLSRIEDGGFPGSSLSDVDDDVAAYWTALDAEIEKAIRDEVDPRNGKSNLKRRNWLLRWYGRYMYRLVGLARGWPAYCTIVNEWQNAWIDADMNRRLAFDLQKAVLDIVAPSSANASETFFTFLQPHVVAEDDTPERVMISLPRNRFEVRARTEGDRIELEIIHGGHADDPPAAGAVLDFHFLREAIARSNGQGFTDSLMLIEPRIERIRASIVSFQLSRSINQHRYKFSHRGGDIVTR